MTSRRDASLYDDDAQPINLSWNRHRRVDRGIDELLGLMRGIAADGQVNPVEVEVLRQWIMTHSEIAPAWPVNVIVNRLRRIYADNIVTPEECEELRLTIDELLGCAQNPQATTALPLCRPAPEIIFDQNVFVFTGKFAFGTRSACESETSVRGGLCKDSITMQTNYVVVGSIGSRDWVHSPYGRKIEAAIEYRGLPGAQLAIVSEERWAEFLLG